MDKVGKTEPVASISNFLDTNSLQTKVDAVAREAFSQSISPIASRGDFSQQEAWMTVAIQKVAEFLRKNNPHNEFSSPLLWFMLIYMLSYFETEIKKQEIWEKLGLSMPPKELDMARFLGKIQTPSLKMKLILALSETRQSLYDRAKSLNPWSHVLIGTPSNLLSQIHTILQEAQLPLGIVEGISDCSLFTALSIDGQWTHHFNTEETELFNGEPAVFLKMTVTPPLKDESFYFQHGIYQEGSIVKKSFGEKYLVVFSQQPLDSDFDKQVKWENPLDDRVRNGQIERCVSATLEVPKLTLKGGRDSQEISSLLQQLSIEELGREIPLGLGQEFIEFKMDREGVKVLYTLEQHSGKGIDDAIFHRVIRFDQTFYLTIVDNNNVVIAQQYVDGSKGLEKAESSQKLKQWLQDVFPEDVKTFLPVFQHYGIEQVDSRSCVQFPTLQLDQWISLSDLETNLKTIKRAALPDQKDIRQALLENSLRFFYNLHAAAFPLTDRLSEMVIHVPLKLENLDTDIKTILETQNPDLVKNGELLKGFITLCQHYGLYPDVNRKAFYFQGLANCFFDFPGYSYEESYENIHNIEIEIRADLAAGLGLEAISEEQLPLLFSVN